MSNAKGLSQTEVGSWLGHLFICALPKENEWTYFVIDSIGFNLTFTCQWLVWVLTFGI